jgi:hypothetical protein
MYLDELDVTPDEREKLRALGATTPLALLGMQKAAPAAFEAHFGTDRATAIAAVLMAQLTEAERGVLAEPARRSGGLGARLKR